MLLGGIFFLIPGFLIVVFLRQKMVEKKRTMEHQKALRESLSQEVLGQKHALEKDVADLNRDLTKTLKMYEAARDICVALEEDQLFLKFKDDLKGLVNFQDCFIFDSDGFDPRSYAADLIFPLLVQEQCLGYLVIKGIERADYPYLEILANHLALGLKRARLYKKIQELAITDSLTGVYTRRYAIERLREEYDRSAAYQLNLSFMMIDVDYFKVCNDKFGHLVGDNVLVEVAGRIRDNIREVDMLARFGGEEFIVFAPNTSKESAYAVAERIRQAIAASPIRAYDEKVSVTVSMGVASYPQDARKPFDLIIRADEALYRAKNSGRNKVCFLGDLK